MIGFCAISECAISEIPSSLQEEGIVCISGSGAAYRCGISVLARAASDTDILSGVYIGSIAARDTAMSGLSRADVAVGSMVSHVVAVDSGTVRATVECSPSASASTIAVSETIARYSAGVSLSPMVVVIEAAEASTYAALTLRSIPSVTRGSIDDRYSALSIRALLHMAESAAESRSALGSAPSLSMAVSDDGVVSQSALDVSLSTTSIIADRIRTPTVIVASASVYVSLVDMSSAIARVDAMMSRAATVTGYGRSAYLIALSDSVDIAAYLHRLAMIPLSLRDTVVFTARSTYTPDSHRSTP